MRRDVTYTGLQHEDHKVVLDKHRIKIVLPPPRKKKKAEVLYALKMQCHKRKKYCENVPDFKESKEA